MRLIKVKIHLHIMLKLTLLELEQLFIPQPLILLHGQLLFR